MENPHEPAPAAALGVCEQLTYVHARYAVSAVPGANSPIQSVGVGEAIAVHWTVTTPPGATAVGLTFKLAVTVNGLLLAIRLNPSSANSRSSYVPGERVLGMVNAQVPVAAADVPGVCEQFTYVHARYAVSAALGAKRPIQSLGVGDVIPAHWTDTVPPDATVTGLAVRLTGAVTVNVLLVAKRTKLSVANSRNS